MSRKFLLFLLLILVFGLGLYGFLGGFNKVRVGLVVAEPRYLVGQFYAGPTQGEDFDRVFREAGRLVEEGVLPGELGGLYYRNPHASPDSIRAFVGVFVADSLVRVPAGMELLRVPGGRQVVRAAVVAHYILAPDRLYPALFDFAEQQGLTLREEYLERFPATRHAVVEVPVVEGR
ncbi:hypothetical protein BH24BAC1_BH24BAC1_35610 [soil metagenome]